MTNSRQWSNAIGLVFFVGLCLAVGGIGAVTTTPEINGWYRTIAKPEWNPPDWIFGPVWTALYISMGIAAWLVWKQAGFLAASRPLLLFAAQLVLNVAWSWIFFGYHQIGWAWLEIMLLWLLIFATTVEFFRRHSIAGTLMVPYLAWVTFAAILNFTIWRLNAGA